MDLSVVIVSYRGRERLTKCLEALNSFTGKNFSMEVIVVNNSPEDKSFMEIENRFSKFRFIHNNINGGYSNGCNLGCSKATGDYFLILNPDTVAREEEIKKLLDAARSNPSYYIISCRQVREDGKESKSSGSFPWERTGRELKGNLKEVTFPDWVSGSVMMMSRNIFAMLNGFDEDFWMYSEDVDLCRRARNKGGEVALYNNISIEHNHGGSTREDLRTTAVSKCEVQISRHLYIHKHEKGIRRILIQVFIVTDNLITGIITGLTGLLLFFIPKIFVRFLLRIRLIDYYSGSLLRRSWLSPRSVNFRKKA
ncbi:MAG: glycosyltransferase family 2 protein [Bacteroidia bacterium]|nr:glycosyltransferase family 2 protein [Bacteroidia bacterium]